MLLFDEGDSTLEARRQILVEQRDEARAFSASKRGSTAWATRSPTTTN